jgi:site-specific recombinase XerD
LELWYKERRTLVDFRRGVLGPYFDGFAATLAKRGYSQTHAHGILGVGCLFNAFLIDRGINKGEEVSETLRDAFLDVYLADARTASRYYLPRGYAHGCLKHLFAYLIEVGAMVPPKEESPVTPYSWLLAPYTRHLQEDCELSPNNIKQAVRQVSAFLEALGSQVRRDRFGHLSAVTVEGYVKQHLKTSPENLSRLAAALRRFFCYCASHGHTPADFSGLIPTVHRYRHAALPKGAEDSVLEHLLKSIARATPTGARDYAIMVLLMAYGIRGVSAAELLLDDIDWQGSRIRIRAQKGGKEVMLPLLEPVGEAIIDWLHHRFADSAFREVFLSTRGPHRPLSGLAISSLVRRRMQKAGVLTPGRGASTLRHSWAIRALGHDSPIKAISDVLGHRYIDTTFIYAKADLKMLREVAMPWPGKE